MERDCAAAAFSTEQKHQLSSEGLAKDLPLSVAPYEA